MGKEVKISGGDFQNFQISFIIVFMGHDVGKDVKISAGGRASEGTKTMMKMML